MFANPSIRRPAHLLAVVVAGGLLTAGGAAGQTSPFDAMGPALGVGALAAERARGATPEDLARIIAESNGAVANNQVQGGVTGQAIMNGSVMGNSGFTTVFQNTGNNVLMQSTTVVQVTIR
jgi:hypothetical protein